MGLDGPRLFLKAVIRASQKFSCYPPSGPREATHQGRAFCGSRLLSSTDRVQQSPRTSLIEGRNVSTLLVSSHSFSCPKTSINAGKSASKS